MTVPAEARYIVVGGLPAPIGGVTSFLRRLLLAEPDRIEQFLDLGRRRLIQGVEIGHIDVDVEIAEALGVEVISRAHVRAFCLLRKLIRVLVVDGGHDANGCDPRAREDRKIVGPGIS